MQITTVAYKVSIKFWLNINEERSNVEYLIKLSQYFGNLAKAVMRSHNETFFSKVSKILVEFDKVFSFESLSFMFCKNLIETLYAPVVICIS